MDISLLIRRGFSTCQTTLFSSAQNQRVGHNKLIAEVKWDGALERDDEPVRTKFKCFSDAVTVKGPKHAVFGDRGVNFELKVHKKNVNVKCRFGILDIDSFKNIISFRT
ncbi:hypothetical protein C1646_670793 [Rhizophagus diaphanus]|nr:hypothetical protein C1646_670793 [Rhizophagus diaphanus] [Rhizophagus sp. MUCL 43196]